MAYEFHRNSRYGWLKVPMPDLYRVGLTQEDISASSYKDVMNMAFYLEEATDMRIFAIRYEEHYGQPPEICRTDNHGVSSFISDLPHVHDTTH